MDEGRRTDGDGDGAARENRQCVNYSYPAIPFSHRTTRFPLPPRREGRDGRAVETHINCKREQEEYCTTLAFREMRRCDEIVL